MKKRLVAHDTFTNKGRRDNNEDISLCEVRGSREEDNRVIVAVADGMGGLKAGEIASEIVSKRLEDFFLKEFTGDLKQTAGGIEACIQSANRSIYEYSQKEKGGARVGTTVSGALVIGNRCLAFNVGDSRTYVINAKGIETLTKDHSADWEAYEAKLLEKKDIGRSTYSNALTRSVGTKPDVKVDISQQNEIKILKEGDILFSCTDGLWGNVTDEEIKKVFNRENDIKKAFEILFKLALKNGSKDNISMAAYRYSGFEGRPKPGIKGDIKKTSAAPPPKEEIAPEPKEPGKKKTEIKKFLKPLLIISLILLPVVVGFLVYFLIPPTIIPDRNVNVVKPINTDIIKETGNDIHGGIIRFEPDGGEFRDSVNVQLSITAPLKSAKGDVIDADIYYTLNGSEPSRSNGKKYLPDTPILIDRDGEYYINARLISKVGSYEGKTRKSRKYTIKSPDQPSGGQPPITGGNITFLKPGGKYTGSEEIPLGYKPLKFFHGKAIFAEIYYTINGDDPTRTNGTLYKENVPVKLSEEGKYTLKARVFSRDGNYEAPKVYSQTYTIQKAVQDIVTVLGGKIRFTVPSGEYRAAVRLQMEFESLRLTGKTSNITDTEIYYTLDGSEPAKATGKRYKQGEILEFTKEGIYPLKARVFSGDGKYMGLSYSQTYFIQYNASGGAIDITPGGGQYTNPVQVRLSIKEPIKKGNDIVEADIYYTLDGKDPGKASGKRCTEDEIIGLTKEGDYTVKARVISRDGKYEGAVYSQEYHIQPPPEKIKTVDNVDNLDNKGEFSKIFERIKERIEISGEGVLSISMKIKVTIGYIDLFVSSSGEFEVRGISGVDVKPAGMIGGIKSRLAQAIKGEKLLKPTSKGKPVNYKKKIDFVNVVQFEGKIKFNK